MAQLFRLSSFFFGSRPSGRHADAAAAPGDAGGSAASTAGGTHAPSELRQPLLEGREACQHEAREDIEAAYDSKFVFSWRRLLLHVGPGALMCIAYVDPGNLEADLQTGATTGYSLLWVLLWSTAMGYLLQSLAARLGVATGKHLAEHCREQYPRGVRLVLWLMAELAIVGSDIQEVIGTAIAISLLSGGAVPLWGGVLLAAASAYVVLFLDRFGVRWLEGVFHLLIAVMSVCFGFLFFSAGIPYADVARGLAVPSLPRAAIPTACALLGALVMPHNIFLHSALVHSRPVEGLSASGMPRLRSAAAKKESMLYYNIESGLALVVTLFINVCVVSTFAKGFYGTAEQEIGLANAGGYLGRAFGASFSLIFGVGLLAAGQSSTMTGTYAGQWVMSGFLDLRISAGMRTLVTRGVAICPTLLVALSARADSTRLDALNQYINILQAVQLPFAVIPLLLLTSDARVMGRACVSSRPVAAAAWAIAAGIILINTAAAYETLVPLIPSAAWLQLAFWSLATCYVGLLIYLILTPEGAQQLAATLSRNASHLSFGRSRPGSAASLAAAGGSPPQPQRLAASPFDQHTPEGVAAPPVASDSQEAAAAAAAAPGGPVDSDASA